MPTPRHFQWTVLTAACLALMSLATASAAPALSSWSLQEIPSLGGTESGAYAINDKGWVTGYATQADGSQRAYLWKPDGSLTVIPTLGGNSGVGRAINQAGQVGGWSARSNGVDAGFIYDTAVNAFTVALAAQPNVPSYVLALNNNGSYTGYTGPTPFIATPTSFVVLPLIGYGLAINDNNRTLVGYPDGTSQLWNTASAVSAGDVVQATYVAMNNSAISTGRVTVSGVSRPVVNSAGAFVINTPNGGAGTGTAINEHNQVVGAYFAGISVFDGSGRAFAVLDATDPDPNAVLNATDLNTLLPASTSNWVLQDAAGINNNFQIVGTGTRDGQQRGYVMSLDGVVWSKAGSGSFADAIGWSYGVLPSQRYAAVIDPSVSATVTLAAGDTVVRRLQVGGADNGDLPLATLHLNGGRLVAGSSAAGQGLFVTARGIVAGEGVVAGDLSNAGRLRTTHLKVDGLFSNSGQLGSNADPDQAIRAQHISNTVAGTLAVAGGRTVELRSTSAVQNSGLIDVRADSTLAVAQGGLDNRSGGQVYLRGGDLVVANGLLNAQGGRVQIEGGVLRSNGLHNQGSIEISYGYAALHGTVVNAAGGRIVISGNGGTTFYGDFDAQANSELRVSAGASATFFGLVEQRTGAMFTGSGVKYYEGGLSIGNSPGRVVDAGDVIFGNGNVYTAEIGGTVPGNGYDQYEVLGKLTFGGTLKLASWQSFSAQVGQRFELFDWGSSAGLFTSIDLSGLSLEDGAVLDTSSLYTDGVIRVTAVPEPGGWALMLSGGAAMGWWMRRRGLSRAEAR